MNQSVLYYFHKRSVTMMILPLGYLALKQLAAIYQIKDLSKFSLITT